MGYYKITEPIGLGDFRAAIHSICENSFLYQEGKCMPPHLLLPLDPGDGRSTALEYAADMFQKHNILTFKDVLDRYIEVEVAPSLNGSIQQIENYAVYDNAYRGITGMDIRQLGNISEHQRDRFLREAARIGKNSYIIFLAGADMSVQEARLAEKLGTCMRLNCLPPQRYSCEELGLLMGKALESWGAAPVDPALLRDLAADAKLRDLQMALFAAEQLMRHADFSNAATPEITLASIQGMKGAISHEK